jgi:hypothetical protein
VDTVTITTLTDDKYPALANLTCTKGGVSDPLPVTLTPGQSFTCTFDGTFIGNAGASQTDLATASGTDDDGQPVSEDDTATVTLTNVPSSIDVQKTVDVSTDADTVFHDSESMPEPGGSATYKVVVTNTSAVDTVTISTLSDNVYPALANLACTKGGVADPLPVTLTPGQSFTCTFTGTVTGNPGVSVTDTATASGTDDDGQAVSDFDTATVTLTNVPSSIDVQKTVDVSTDGDTVFHDTESMPEPGGSATFKVVVTNTSAVDTVTISTLSDNVYPALANLACFKGGVSDPLPVTLAPGQSFTCTFTGTVTGNPGTSVTDTATASGTDDDGVPVSDTDTARVNLTNVLPTILVIKTANPTIVPFSGGNVTYTVSIQNTSVSSDPVTIQTLTDNQFGNLANRGNCGALIGVTLQPGQTVSCQFTVFLQGQPDPDGTGILPHVNVATATGVDDEGSPATDSDDATVNFSWRGRTPGYWKNHPEAWPTFSITNFNGQTVAVKPTTKVTDVFRAPNQCRTTINGQSTVDLNGDGKADTLLDALGYEGGTTLCGAYQILLRAGVAALLNEAEFGTQYPPFSSPQNAVNTINQVIQTNNRNKYLQAAAILDFWNNGVH